MGRSDEVLSFINQFSIKYKQYDLYTFYPITNEKLETDRKLVSQLIDAIGDHLIAYGFDINYKPTSLGDKLEQAIGYLLKFSSVS
jgi:hypothetical protein